MDLENFSDDEILLFLSTYQDAFDRLLSGIPSGPRRAYAAGPAHISAARTGLGMLALSRNSRARLGL